MEEALSVSLDGFLGKRAGKRRWALALFTFHVPGVISAGLGDG